MALKDIHLTMICEALGVMGKEICSEIVQLHQKAAAYDNLKARMENEDEDDPLSKSAKRKRKATEG
jgi:hypothetical protein